MIGIIVIVVEDSHFRLGGSVLRLRCVTVATGSFQMVQMVCSDVEREEPEEQLDWFVPTYTNRRPTGQPHLNGPESTERSY